MTQAPVFDQLNEMLPMDETNTSGFLDQLRIKHTSSQETTPPVASDHSVPEDTSNSKTPIETFDLPAEARRALISLLRHGVILTTQKAKLFESLCRYQNAIRQHLSQIYLRLVLDDKAGVAFIVSLDSEMEAEENPLAEDEVVSLISRRTLSLYDTLLLLVLRKYYQDRETAGEQRIVIDIDRIESYLTPFLPLTNSTKSDRNKLFSALNNLESRKIVTALRGSDDRFEITPVIRYVVGAEFLETLLAKYLKIAQEQGIELNEHH